MEVEGDIAVRIHDKTANIIDMTQPIAPDANMV